MANFLNKLLSGTRHYTLFDFAMLKFALLFIGILLGTYFSRFFSDFLPVVWILAIFCYATIVAITLTKAFGKSKPEKGKKRR